MAHRPLTILERQAFLQDEFVQSAAVKQKIFDRCADKVLEAVDAIIHALNADRKILLCGNGGSAADAQHIATEFVIRMSPGITRPGIPAVALTTDTSMLTAGANDIGYDNVFARAVEALGREGDILIAISTSGMSESINRAVRAAASRRMVTIGFLGRDGGQTRSLVDIPIVVPSDNTQRIQEGHITIGHAIVGLVEREMYGGNE